MRQLLLTTFLSVLLLSAHAGGPWTPGKGKGLFVFSATPIIYTSISSGDGAFDGLQLHRRVTDITFQGYVEHGFSNRLAMIFNIPYKYVRTSSNLTGNGDLPDTIPSGSLIGMGNIEVGLKYQLLKEKKLQMAGSLTLEAGTAWDKEKEGLRTGYDTWGFVPMIHAGMSFAKRAWWQAEAGAAIRVNNSYSEEVRFSFEIGSGFKKPFTAAFLLQVRQSLENGDRTNSPNDFQTGLYLNNESYVAWSGKFSYNFKENFGIVWSFGGGAVTQYIARAPSITFGVMKKW